MLVKSQNIGQEIGLTEVNESFAIHIIGTRIVFVILWHHIYIYWNVSLGSTPQ